MIQHRLFRMMVMAAVLALAGCVSVPPSPGPFYRAPAALTGRPGDLLRAEPLPGAPGQATAYRILYQSTGLDGRPIAVSGILIAPPGPTPADGRAVVAWAHPTTGVATACAPSLQPHVFDTIPGLTLLLERGFAVVATDYEGLGTAGTHPYLVGVSEGRGVLDAVRAGRQAPGVGLGSRFAVWGHSQGGHAALFAGELAAAYAPELTLVGVAAAAPATDLAALLAADLDSRAGRILGAYALWAWARVYGAALGQIVAADALPAIERVVKDCIETRGEGLRAAADSNPLGRDFLTAQPQDVEPWRTYLAQNTPGQAPPGAPVFISQGAADTVVRPDVTAAFVQGVCRHGQAVRFLKLDGVDHLTVAKISSPTAVEWLAERFAGAAAANDCP